MSQARTYLPDNIRKFEQLIEKSSKGRAHLMHINGDIYTIYGYDHSAQEASITEPNNPDIGCISVWSYHTIDDYCHFKKLEGNQLKLIDLAGD